MPEQLGLNLPVRTALGRDAFFVAPSNAVAVAMIDAPWPQGKLVISGPEGAGKTHLAHVWAERSGARIIAAAALEAADVEALAEGPLVVEDVPQIAADAKKQTALFHVHNLLIAAWRPLLMTGTPPPNLWHMSLPDLQSRIDAAGHAALETPNDDLLAAVLAKLFADRGLKPRPDVIPYLVTRMERSFAAAGQIVAALDTQSLADRRDITRSYAMGILDKLV